MNVNVHNELNFLNDTDILPSPHLVPIIKIMRVDKVFIFISYTIYFANNYLEKSMCV